MREPMAGELKTRVAIRPWQDKATGFNDVETVDGAAVYRWAKVAAVGAAMYWGSKQIDTGVTHIITVRYCGCVSGRHVVEGGGLRYRVLRFKHSTGAKRWTWLECELLGGA